MSPLLPVEQERLSSVSGKGYYIFYLICKS